ncbi:MAG: SpoIIE family protein phosphatase [Armatimonadetes bacterium]|nr:SpoIIE family protein phosphatase [Armatimonadota bacterium]
MGGTVSRAIARWAVVAALIAVVVWVDFILAPSIDAAFFYFLPIVLGCVWFGWWGLAIIPIALALYHLNQVAVVPPIGRYNIGNTAVKSMSFSLIATLTLTAQFRYRRLQAAQQREQDLRRAAELGRARMQSLYRLANAANAVQDPEGFFRVLPREALGLLPQMSAAAVFERQGDRLVARSAAGPHAEEAMAVPVALGEGVIGRVAATGRPALARAAADGGGAGDGRHPLEVRAGVLVAAPMVLKGKTIAVVAVAGPQAAHLDEDDFWTVEWMSSEAALVLESLRLYRELRDVNAGLQERQLVLDQQLDMAREVQSAILSVTPSRCRTRSLDIVSYHAPALQIGGDLLRVVPGPDGTALFVGDVMGKGVPAALLMTMMTAELSRHADRAADVGAILREANQVLTYNVGEFLGFVTVFYLYISEVGLRLRYAAAGHPPAILVHPDGDAEWLAGEGPPLGITGAAAYPAAERALGRGDRLVVYTDGVTEARSAAGEFFGSEQLFEVVRRYRAGSPAALRDAIVEAVHEFATGRPLPDDMTLVVIAVDPDDG